jgi:hypothetical protein
VRPQSFRFYPPRVELEPELRWVFLRAFGPVAKETSSPPTAEKAVALAKAFDLQPRIAARQGYERLVAELGSVAAEEIFLAQAAVKAEARRSRRTGTVIAEAAAESRLPIVFLKYSALREIGVLLEGSRPAMDVDVLAPAAGAAEFARRLQQSGYVVDDYPGSEHQLSIMVHRTLSPVEIHIVVPGVRVPGSQRSMTVEDLRAQGLVAPVEAGPGECLLPERFILVAHAIAHGIAQHGVSPAAYPMTRMLADLIDLGVCGREEGSLVDRAYPFISRAVSHEEARAVEALCGRLFRAELEADEERTGEARPEDRLLQHVVAGILEPDYEDALRLTVHRRGLSDRSFPVSLAQRLWRMVFKTRAELDMIYGRPGHPSAYLWRRLLRPFDLVLRLFRYGGSFWRLRTRSDGTAGKKG